MSASFRRMMISGVAAIGLTGGVIAASPVGPVHAASQTITLLNVNDFHGRIDPAGDLTTKWATTIEQQRALDPTGTLLLGAGDLIGASLFNSAVQNDQPTIDVMNELCMNASSVGNHEFDKGFADLTGRVIGGAAGVAPDACPAFGSGTTPGGTNARWAYLGANVYLKGTQTPALPEYTIFTVKGVTIGVIGAVTSETPALVSPGGITQIDIGDPVASVNRVAAQLSDNNPSNGEAQVLVAEYHEGAANGAATLDQNLALPAPNPFAAIVNGTSPQVDVIFTGHTHQVYAYDAPVAGGSLPTRPVLQTGNYADHVGKVVLTVNDQTGAVTAHTASNLLPATTPDYSLPRVAKVKSIVDAAKAVADTVGLQPIGTQTADITTAFTGGAYTGPGGTYVGSGPTPTTGRDDRSKESSLGDLVANALRDTLAPTPLGGAQIGVTNPGGLRAELLSQQSGAEGTGVITYAEANNVLPFVNNLWTTTLTGAQFKTLLEQQWQRDANNQVPTRPYLQLGLSDNVTYTYDDTLPEGSRITSITINGAPYQPTASYRIGTFSFLATGGDNFRIFTSGTNTKDSGLVDRDAWIAYLTSHSPTSPDFARQALKATNLPTAVAIGANLQFGVGALDLTSLGSPANTSLNVSIGGVAVGAVPVANGAATVNLAVPAGVPSGSQMMTAVACPSGTKLVVPVTVSGATSSTPAPKPAVTSCGLQVTSPALRLLDTRVSPAQRAEFVPGSTLKVDIAGKYGIDPTASAVALNVTSVGVTAEGWIRAYPCATTPASLTSNLNQVGGHVVANLAVVALDSSGSICFETSTTSDLVVDIEGWYPAGSDYRSIQATRIADTRIGLGIPTHLTPGVPVELMVAGANGVAPTASAASLNLTAVADLPGYITAYPCGTAPPLASNLNTWAGHAIANSATTAIGTGGKICFVSNINTDLVVDLEGWYPAGASYHAFTPVRALDTRVTGPTPAAGEVKVVTVAGNYGVPTTAKTVSLNVTAVNAAGPAWVKVFPCGQPQPETSNNNTSPDRVVATQTLVPIGLSGSVCIVSNWSTDIVVDVQGWQ